MRPQLLKMLGARHSSSWTQNYEDGPEEVLMWIFVFFWFKEYINYNYSWVHSYWFLILISE